MTIEVFAPAKINLTLHVTGRRADGYHLLDSLVAFADVGDRITVAPASGLSLRVTGPMAAAVPQGADNLVLRAARLIGPTQGAAITLDKHLPVASGIGGGSSDAAATLRALSHLWAAPLPGMDRVAALGADVPVCLDPRPTRMSGTGGTLVPVTPMPDCALVLINPGQPLATASVFATRADNDGAPMPDVLPAFVDAASLAAFLAAMRNDLEEPACTLVPTIGTVLHALAATDGCLIARMSGSGATCFGLFADIGLAGAAAARISRGRPGWWVRSAAML